MTRSDEARSYVVTGAGRGLGRALVERLLRDGGHVVAVELGPTAAARVEEEMRLLHPVGRVGRPDEVAATIAHLLSDRPRPRGARDLSCG